MIGDLRHRVTLEEEVSADDGCGGFTSDWIAVRDMWADLAEPAGREDPPDAERQVRVTVRWSAGLRPSMRFIHEGRVFGIQAVRDGEGRARRLVCDCVERRLP